MNKNNNNTITPHKTLTLLNNAFKIIVEKEKYYMKNSKSPIDLDTIKSLYEGFYAGFKLLLKLPDLPYDIKFDLIAKKSMVDLQYSSNITYPEYNRLKNYKSFANKTLKYNKYLNQKATELTNLQALELKAKISELNNEENKYLNQLKTNSNLANIATNMENLTLKKPNKL
jgi:hypothetical protein